MKEKRIKKGATRWVFLVGKYAFKIPSLHSWKCFLWGLLANMKEKEFSGIKDEEFKNKLCPIVFHIPLGFLVVMPKVRVLKNKELSIEKLNKFCNSTFATIPAELKYDSFGYYKNKLVAIDYG